MKMTHVLRLATHVVLGSMVALVTTFCLLVLSDLNKLETRVAEMSSMRIANLGTVESAARIASGHLAASAIKQTSTPKSTACLTWEPQLTSRAATLPSVPLNGTDCPRLAEQAQGLRQVNLASSESTLLALTGAHSSLFSAGYFGNALLVWGEAPRLFREAIQSASFDQAVGATGAADGFRRLRERAMFIGMATVISSLVLLVLIYSSFVSAKAQMLEVVQAKQNLELSAEERAAELQRAITALRLYSTHVDAAIEEERVRIAHEIHGELGSILTALKFELVGISGGRSAAGRKPLVRRASTALVDSALRSVRSLIAALHPYPLERAGLWGALVWKAGEFEKSFGIPCCVVMSEDLPQPSRQISIAAFRIVEEALTNVARHARAAAVEIVVHFVADQLVIEITDDGCGIPNGAAVGAGSYGLTGMSERARAVGGALTLAARVDRGTTVRFSVQVEVQPPLDGKAS